MSYEVKWWLTASVFIGALFIMVIIVMVINERSREADRRSCSDVGREFFTTGHDSWFCRDPKTGQLYR